MENDGGYASKAMAGAYRKGYEAGKRWREKRWTNPYRDKRNGRGGVTFARAFRKAWYEGFNAGQCDA